MYNCPNFSAVSIITINFKVSVPSELPYTVASLPFRHEPPVGSGVVEVPLEGQKSVNVEEIDQMEKTPDVWVENVPFIDKSANQK